MNVIAKALIQYYHKMVSATAKMRRQENTPNQIHRVLSTPAKA
jgi:hypothetical protein